MAKRKRPTPKGSPSKLRPDVAETGFRVFQEAVGEKPKTLPPSERTENNADAVMRGAKGGRKGGPARADALSAEKGARMTKRAQEVDAHAITPIC